MRAQPVIDPTGRDNPARIDRRVAVDDDRRIRGGQRCQTACRRQGCAAANGDCAAIVLVGRNQAGGVAGAIGEAGLGIGGNVRCPPGQKVREGQGLAGGHGNDHAVLVAAVVVRQADVGGRIDRRGGRNVGAEFLAGAGDIGLGGIAVAASPGAGQRGLVRRILDLALPHVPLRRIDREARAPDQDRHAERDQQRGIAAGAGLDFADCAANRAEHGAPEIESKWLAISHLW